MLKDKKTTYVAIAAGLGFIASVLLVFIGKSTLVEAGAYLGAYSAFLVSILGILTKDSDPKSSDEETLVKSIDKVFIETSRTEHIVIPGRGLKEPPPEEDIPQRIQISVTLENGEQKTLSVG